MFEIGQGVIVITDKGVSYDATILARAKGEDGLAAYKVTVRGRGLDQLGQWHKASDVFMEEGLSDTNLVSLHDFMER